MTSEPQEPERCTVGEFSKAVSSNTIFDTLAPFLARYGYAAQGGSAWQLVREANSEGPAPERHPHLELHLRGHIEEQGHTLYEVESLLAAHPAPQVSFLVRRRLCQFREALHDPIKVHLGAAAYDRHFGTSPFAKKGGLPGTTARLQGWCAALAACANSRGCPPGTLALVLHFFEVPEPQLPSASLANLAPPLVSFEEAVAPASQEDTDMLEEEVVREWSSWQADWVAV